MSIKSVNVALLSFLWVQRTQEKLSLQSNGIQATDTVMLLHRAGAFEGDMLFDLNSDTVVKYNALMVRSGFLLHTESYSLTENDGKIITKLAYTLHDGSEQDEIKGTQEITVNLMDDN